MISPEMQPVLLLGLLTIYVVLGAIGIRRSPPSRTPPPPPTFEEWAHIYDSTGRGSRRERDPLEDAVYSAYALGAVCRRKSMTTTAPVRPQSRLLTFILRPLLHTLKALVKRYRRTAAEVLAFAGGMLCFVTLLSLEFSPALALAP
ncbi:hypothetical protein GO986_18835, partial [Deinococcus sp. HMF7620]|nr:hypothetical protein [Deinococcus arboris]